MDHKSTLWDAGRHDCLADSSVPQLHAMERKSATQTEATQLVSIIPEYWIGKWDD